MEDIEQQIIRFIAYEMRYNKLYPVQDIHLPFLMKLVKEVNESGGDILLKISHNQIMKLDNEDFAPNYDAHEIEVWNNGAQRMDKKIVKAPNRAHLTTIKNRT